MIKALLLIGTGGFFGSICRYLLTRFITLQWPSAFPFGTLAVNVLGCLAIGLLMGLFLNNSISSRALLLLATGFCGGFTTFSTFSLELFEVYQKGQWGLSLTYVLASIILGFLAVGIGLWIVKGLKV